MVFGGFINQAELPKVYAVSDIFVFLSENEPFGLIVNEVMCAGVPVVFSDEVGCVPDLVKEGVNSCHIKAGDVGSLAAAIEKLLVDEPRRKRMGAAGRTIMNGWSYEQCRQGIIAAQRQCIESDDRQGETRDEDEVARFKT